jgi:hypothetical protein
MILSIVLYNYNINPWYDIDIVILFLCVQDLTKALSTLGCPMSRPMNSM